MPLRDHGAAETEAKHFVDVNFEFKLSGNVRRKLAQELLVRILLAPCEKDEEFKQHLDRESIFQILLFFI